MQFSFPLLETTDFLFQIGAFYVPNKGLRLKDCLLRTGQSLQDSKRKCSRCTGEKEEEAFVPGASAPSSMVGAKDYTFSEYSESACGAQEPATQKDVQPGLRQCRVRGRCRFWAAGWMSVGRRESFSALAKRPAPRSIAPEEYRAQGCARLSGELETQPSAP